MTPSRPLALGLLLVCMPVVASCGDDSAATPPEEPGPSDDVVPPYIQLISVGQTDPVPTRVHVTLRVRAESRPLAPEGSWSVSDGPEGTFPVEGDGSVEFDLEGLDPGEYSITVQVRDEDGLASTDQRDFRVVLAFEPVDLDVGWISRSSPRIPFEKQYAESTPDEGWPSPGQEVTWSARVINRSDALLEDVDYVWLLDGEEVGGGVVDVPGHTGVDVDLPLTWEDRRQELTFRADIEDDYEEVEEANNEVMVYTDALAVGFKISERMYRRFRETQREFGRGTNSFEDWAQYQIRDWNELFGSSTDPELAPDGILDRLRLDYVEVWEDGTLPLTEWLWNDPEVDLHYLFPWRTVESALQFVDSNSLLKDFDPADQQLTRFHLHEMLHHRYLVDIYAFDVAHDPPGRKILITEGGELVAGSEHMPFDQSGGKHIEGRVYTYPDQGVMGRDRKRFSLHSVVALNLVAGRRSHWDPYTSAWEREGHSYLRDVPAENRLMVTDEDGTPLSGARVEVYHDTTWRRYGEHYDDVPDLIRRADETGAVLLGPNPFGPLLESLDKALVAIVRVEHEGRVGYGFLPLADFNLEYWRGHTELGEYELAVTLREP